MTDYTELQKAAKYATQDTIKFADEDEEMRALQQFHEEVNPETVLALIADLDEARNGMKHSCAIRLKKEIERLESEAVYSDAGFDAAREEISKLRAEVAGLKTGYQAYERVNAELKAEVGALRKDADRLDRLEIECEAYGTDIHEGNRWAVDGPLATVRNAIDAAMGKGEQS